MVAERARQIDGRRRRWLEAGEPGSPDVLVWLHAFPVSAESWRPQLEAPPAGWRVLAPDLAGFGGSEDRDGPPSIDDYASDVESLLASLDIGPVVLGGVSMGGYAAFAYLRVAADRVRALILAGARATADSVEAREGRQRMLRVIEEQGTAGVADEMLPRLLGSTSRRKRPLLVDHVRRLIEANRPEGIRRGVLRLRDRPDATAQLRHITVPLHILVGAEDVVTPPDEARRMADAVEGARLTIVPAAGHLANLENPDPFNAAIRPWLAEL